MIEIHTEDDSPVPRLAETIARQREVGGRLVLYRRMWSAFVVSMGQNRVEHVAPGRSRILAGIRHTVFTLFLGIWSISGLLTVPLIVIVNTRGGIDVTAQLAGGSIDKLRVLEADPKQSEKDVKMAQWFYIVFLFGVAIACYFYFSSL